MCCIWCTRYVMIITGRSQRSDSGYRSTGGREQERERESNKHRTINKTCSIKVGSQCDERPCIVLICETQIFIIVIFL